MHTPTMLEFVGLIIYYFWPLLIVGFIGTSFFVKDVVKLHRENHKNHRSQ